MKSNTCAAFLTMLLLVVYPLVMGMPTSTIKDMASFVPEGSLIYFEQRHGLAFLHEFAESPLGKKIEEIDFLKTGKKIGLTTSHLASLSGIRALYAGAKRSQLLHEFLGQGFAVALLAPINGKQSFDDIADIIRDNTIVVAKPEHNAEQLEFLGERYGRYSQAYLVSSIQYGNHQIKRIAINGQTFSLVTLEGYFVISLNEDQVRRCIDTFDKQLPALAEGIEFTAIRKKVKTPDCFFYLPVNNMRQFLAKTVTAMTFDSKELLLKELETTIGFSAFGYGSWNSKARVVDKVVVRYHHDAVNSVVKNHLDTAPTRCSMLSLTTEDPMAFYWSNTVMMQQLLHYFEMSRKTEPLLDKFWSRLEHITGKRSEDLMSLIGEEMGIILESGPEDKFFSVPLGVVFLQVKDVPELKALLDKIVAEYRIPVSVQTDGPISYVYWTGSPQDGLQPLYGFWHDLFFFGNSTDLLRMVMKNSSDDHSLLDKVAAQAIDPGFSEKNNSIAYLNNVALIKVVKRLLELVGVTLAIEDREAAYKVRVVLDEIIDPLLDGASMYDKRCTRSYFTPDMVVIDSITKIALDPNKQRIK